LLVANTGVRLSAMQSDATATPERTQRPRPQASPTIGQALITIEQDTQLFSQPDNTSEIIFPLPTTPNNFGRLLAVTRDQRWYQIEIGNTTGWVSSSAARIVGNPTGILYVSLTPVPVTPGATPTLAPIATERMVGAYPTILIRNRREVYSGTSPFFPTIGLIMPGQTVEILAVVSGRTEWYLVRYDNGAGWITGQFERDIEGDISGLLHLSAPPDPTADYSRFLAQSPGDIEPFLASATPAPPGAVSPTQVPGPAHVADQIDMLLEPAVPPGSFTAEQLTAAAETLRARIGQYPVSDFSVEVDTSANTIHVRFADNYYREEIISLMQQEGLFEAVNFADQSVELRAALLHETILTSGYRSRESERLRLMGETFGTNRSDDLFAHGFSFSERLRNPLEINHPFNTFMDDQSVAGASMVPGRNLWDVVVTLT
ncbi:MAG: SH3 domain-containing protein, partial [Anaerolineae bacterium]|nr:SH3 domain-containing protein [Anaerolineae bacterium]